MLEIIKQIEEMYYPDYQKMWEILKEQFKQQEIQEEEFNKDEDVELIENELNYIVEINKALDNILK